MPINEFSCLHVVFHEFHLVEIARGAVLVDLEVVLHGFDGKGVSFLAKDDNEEFQKC